MRYPFATLVFLLAVAAWLFNVRPFSFVMAGAAVALAIVVLVMAWESAERRKTALASLADHPSPGTGAPDKRAGHDDGLARFRAVAGVTGQSADPNDRPI